MTVPRLYLIGAALQGLGVLGICGAHKAQNSPYLLISATALVLGVLCCLWSMWGDH